VANGADTTVDVSVNGVTILAHGREPAMFSMRLPRIALALCFAFAASACGSGPAPAGPVDPGFAGHWTSTQWGEHYIIVEGSTVRIVYSHDDGRVLGTLNGSQVTGWWTEVPSRDAPKDAGDVTFSLTEVDGKRAIDGVWSYGDDGTQRENWDLLWVDDVIPSDIAMKFSDSTGFTSRTLLSVVQ
jgi:hypothetical protein